MLKKFLGRRVRQVIANHFTLNAYISVSLNFIIKHKTVFKACACLQMKKLNDGLVLMSLGLSVRRGAAARQCAARRLLERSVLVERKPASAMGREHLTPRNSCWRRAFNRIFSQREKKGRVVGLVSTDNTRFCDVKCRREQNLLRRGEHRFLTKKEK